jgi:hypothetical protein
VGTQGPPVFDVCWPPLSGDDVFDLEAEGRVLALTLGSTALLLVERDAAILGFCVLVKMSNVRKPLSAYLVSSHRVVDLLSRHGLAYYVSDSICAPDATAGAGPPPIPNRCRHPHTPWALSSVLEVGRNDYSLASFGNCRPVYHPSVRDVVVNPRSPIASIESVELIVVADEKQVCFTSQPDVIGVGASFELQSIDRISPAVPVVTAPRVADGYP